MELLLGNFSYCGDVAEEKDISCVNDSIAVTRPFSRHLIAIDDIAYL